ncbi:unnamed protein product [Effrenium voratum]|nr:unnamed protein product [Effrenium voratum]
MKCARRSLQGSSERWHGGLLCGVLPGGSGTLHLPGAERKVSALKPCALAQGWDQYRNRRHENEGSRIDYVLVDRAFFERHAAKGAGLDSRGLAPESPGAALAAATYGGLSQPSPFVGGGMRAEGKFDPEQLEKGAAALKEIDASRHAKLAFDIASAEERTSQLRALSEMEKQKTMRAQMEEQIVAAQAEEARKTISYLAEQERLTAQHKAEVENSLQGRKLELQKEVTEYQLRREQEQFMQHEAMRIRNEKQLEEEVRETIRARGAQDIETAKAAAHAEAAGRAQQERENVDVRLREYRAQQAEARKTALDSINTFFSSMSAGAEALYEDRAKAVSLVGGLTLLAGGIYSARAATRVAARVMERHFSRPPLVRETSRWSWRPQLSLFPQHTTNLFARIVLEENLAERLRWSTNALLSAQQNGTPFRHLLLHGPPGTGKTLFARTLARESGLDYAVMSGGDLGPLGREGPHELHKLFEWAQKSRKGLVLFIDEADAFLRRGRAGAMSEDARNSLSVFLHHTGTENAHIAVILATNVPTVLDRAVLDRIDEGFEFPRPAYPQRLQMLQMFADQYLHRKKGNRAMIEVDPELDDKFLEDVAKRTEGMSGRQLAKLVLAFQSAVFGSGTMRLTQGLAQTVLQWRLSHPNVE